MQFVGNICGVFVLTVLTRLLKYQIFSRVSWFLLNETINLLSISHIPMTHLTHFRFFLEQAHVYIQIENLTRKWTKSGAFFSKIWTLFSIFKKGLNIFSNFKILILILKVTVESKSSVFLVITPSASKTTYTKVCKLSLNHMYTSRNMLEQRQIIFDWQLHKLILQTNTIALAAKQDVHC